jgi:hypothetical protein
MKPWTLACCQIRFVTSMVALRLAEYPVTTAVRAGCLFRVMLCHGQNLLECFLAGVTEELIVGHTDLPQSKNGCSWILDPWLEQVQLSPYALRTVNSTYTAGV